MISDFNFGSGERREYRTEKMGSTAEFLQELRTIEDDAKRTAGMAIVAGSLRAIVDNNVMRENSAVFAAETGSSAVRAPSRMLPETRNYFERVEAELQANRRLVAAESELARTRPEFHRLSLRQAQAIGQSMDAIKLLQRYGDSSKLTAEVAHLDFMRKLSLSEHTEVQGLVARHTGTMNEVSAGEKLFAFNTVRHAQVASYAEAKTAFLSGLQNLTETKQALKHAAEQTALARRAGELSLGGNSALVSGFGRGAGGMLFAASALTAMDLVVRQMKGESIALDTYAPSELMRANEVDAIGIGFLASKTMPGKARALGYIATLAAGRGWNAVFSRSEAR